MKNPDIMTPFELEVLWEFGATKAEIRDAQARNSRTQEAAQDAQLLADWRAEYPDLAGAPSHIALALAKLWQQVGR
jgi:hypothetical protein